ncbi:Uncharacterised protein [Raoultella planticola]|uniref:Uncharacterized protein n=1 Tax=Raoultella planticola TaxID=575 RepID=A0A485CUV5_RAOPL|nr:Uncharacterised protein [Raoultella planticola]
MKLVRYTHHGRTRLGKVVDSTVIDLSEITGIDHSMRQLLNALPALRERLERVAGPAIALEEVRLEAPIHDPQKFLGIVCRTIASMPRRHAGRGFAIPVIANVV